MKKIFTKFSFFSFLVLSLFFSTELKATHIAGGQITYTCLGNNKYIVYLTLYRECNSGSSGMLATESYDVTGNGCGGANFSRNAPCVNCNAAGNGPVATPLCAAPVGFNCENFAAGAVGVPILEVYQYVDTLTLPANCPNWTISYGSCCRPNAINGGLDGFYFYANLNNTLPTCNNSPVVKTDPIIYACPGNLRKTSLGVYDPEGDSLAYDLVAPLEDPAPGTPLTAAPWYWTPTNPLLSGLSINPTTGQFSVLVATQGSYVVGVRIREYRNGVQIGEIRRDVYIAVVNLPGCATNSAPYFDSTVYNVVGGSKMAADSVVVCAGTTLSLKFKGYRVSSATDTTLKITLDTAKLDSKVSLNDVSLVSSYIDLPAAPPTLDTLVGDFTWNVPANIQPGLYLITASINNCIDGNAGTGIQVNFKEDFTLKVLVPKNTTAYGYNKYCASGDTLVINAVGVPPFKWQIINGDTNAIKWANSDSSQIKVTVNQHTKLVVQSDSAFLTSGGLCKFIDSIDIFLVPDFTYTHSVSDDTICVGETSILTAIPDPSQAPYNYLWTNLSATNPTTAIVGASTANPISVSPVIGSNFQVLMTSALGCRRMDTMHIEVSGYAPYVNVALDKNNICPNDTIKTTTSVSATPCGDNQLTPNNNPLFSVTPGGTNLTGIATFPAIYGNWQFSSRTQFIYKASELYAAGLLPGRIIKVDFKLAEVNSGKVYNNFEIKMGCTLDSNYDVNQNFKNALTTVYLGRDSLFSVGDWMPHTLQTPFVWDGVSNLVIETCFRNSTRPNNSHTEDNLTVDNTVIYNTGTSTANPSCGSNTVVGVSKSRPRVRFFSYDFAPVTLSYNWTPATGLSCANCPNPTIVTGENRNYTLQVSDGNCTGTYSANVKIDSSYYIGASPDTNKCGTDSVQLSVETFGNPPLKVSCGALNKQHDGIAPINFAAFNDGTTSTATTAGGFLMDDSWSGSKTQVLLKATDLIAGGMKPGTILSVAVDLATITADRTLRNFEMKMKCTNATSLSLGAGFISGAQTVVKADSIVIPASASNTQFRLRNPLKTGLDTTFDWNGTDNILIELCFYNNHLPIGYPTRALSFKDKNLGYTGFLHNRQDGNPFICTSNPISSSQIIPNFKFIMFEAPVDTIIYTWSPNYNIDSTHSKTPKVWPDRDTTYIVKASFANGCDRYDTVRVKFKTIPVDVTANKTAICVGDSVLLTAVGGAIVKWTATNGLATNLTSTSVWAKPTQTTTYVCKIADAQGCFGYDSVTVSVQSLASLNLGVNTTICAEDSVVLSIPAGAYANPRWYKNSLQVATGTTYTAKSSGTYYFVVDSGTCSYASTNKVVSIRSIDTVHITPLTRNICPGDNVLLQIVPGSGVLTFNWNNNFATTQVNNVTTQGTYFLVDPKNQYGCAMISDVAIIVASTPPVVSLGLNRSYCGFYDTLRPTPKLAGVTYTWMPNNVTQDSLVIAAPGTYTVTADKNGCKNTASVTISRILPQNANVVPQNRSICCGDSVTLSVANPTAYNKYLWSTKDTSATLKVKQSGLYAVTAYNSGSGCPDTGSAYVKALCLQPIIHPIGPINILFDSAISLQTIVNTQAPGDVVTYSWVLLQNTLSKLAGDTTTARPTLPGVNKYRTVVTVTDGQITCTDSADRDVNVYVLPLTIPKVFTPNGDRINDVLTILPTGGISLIDVRIYNKWGQIVHSGLTSWDGYYNGELQNNDNYVVYALYDIPDANNPGQMVRNAIQQVVTLIR